MKYAELRIPSYEDVDPFYIKPISSRQQKLIFPRSEDNCEWLKPLQAESKICD